jgi:hypothetical protein
MNNDLYNEKITTERGTYKYDPDMDAYYRIYAERELSHWETYSPLYVIAILTILCLLSA